jgi:hypothetical protein
MEHEHQDNLLQTAQSLDMLGDCPAFALLAECLEIAGIDPLSANEPLEETLSEKISELEF